MAFEFTRTASPSRAICCDVETDQFFTVETRTGALVSDFGKQMAFAYLNDVAALDAEAQAFPCEFGPKHFVKLRRLFIDDKSGSLTLYVDYLHDRGEEPLFTEAGIKLSLGDGSANDFGQGVWVEVRVSQVLCSSDSFSPVSDVFYSS